VGQLARCANCLSFMWKRKCHVLRRQVRVQIDPEARHVALSQPLGMELMAIHISQPARIRREDLDQLGPVKAPLDSPTACLIGKKFIDDIPGIDSMGIWECSPGRWQRTIMQEEFAHFLTGSATFIPTGGTPIEIRAGDTIWFPANSCGVWDIRENVRKVYVVIDRPGVWKTFKRWMKRVFAAKHVRAPALSIVPAHIGATILADVLADGRLL